MDASTLRIVIATLRQDILVYELKGLTPPQELRDELAAAEYELLADAAALS